MKTGRANGRKGASFLEFTLVGIGMIFFLISFVWMAIGMWTYQTLAYAVREGTRYAIVHGQDCKSPNTCQVTIGDIVGVVKAAGPGLNPNNTTVTLTTDSGVSTSGSITTLLSNTTKWPPSTDYAPGQNVTIKAVAPVPIFLMMFWPGAGHAKNYSGVFHLGASSTEGIEY